MSNSKSFSGKVVIVTGSTSGIGEAIAIYLSNLGDNVVITGRREDELKRVAKLCESFSPKQLKPLEVVVDITDDEHAKRLIENTVKTFGQIDVLVNNAGTTRFSFIYDNDFMGKYETLMSLNLRSVVCLTHLAVSYLQKTKGNIDKINQIYCISKAALDMFTKCLAIELGPKGIRVNNVNPGPVVSNMLIAAGKTAEQSDTSFRNFAKRTLLGFVGTPKDIAFAVALLASIDAQFITGTLLTADGGAALWTNNSAK